MLDSIFLNRAKPRLLSILQSKRFGGGGGRPAGHGRPSFNFKEKKILGLDKKYKKFNPQPSGFFSDIEEFFDPARDVRVKLSEKEDFEEPNMDWDSNDKKVFNVAALYGSNKSYGMLVRKQKRKPYKRNLDWKDDAKEISSS